MSVTLDAIITSVACAAAIAMAIVTLFSSNETP
jgi:hypothetical protein